MKTVKGDAPEITLVCEFPVTRRRFDRRGALPDLSYVGLALRNHAADRLEVLKECYQALRPGPAGLVADFRGIFREPEDLQGPRIRRCDLGISVLLESQQDIGRWVRMINSEHAVVVMMDSARALGFLDDHARRFYWDPGGFSFWGKWYGGAYLENILPDEVVAFLASGHDEIGFFGSMAMIAKIVCWAAGWVQQAVGAGTRDSG